MAEEQVLCFERKLLEELGLFQGLSLEIEKYLPVLSASANNFYLKRSEAELDRGRKQLIPYVLVLCHDRILRYRRGKGGQETRLHGLYSVGIGGHISLEDHDLFSTASGYHDGMRRELKEEVDVEELNEAAVAVINDDSTEVGYVHFGVVHIMQVANENVVGTAAAFSPRNSFPLPTRSKTRRDTNPGPASAWRIWTRSFPRLPPPASPFPSARWADRSDYSLSSTPSGGEGKGEELPHSLAPRGRGLG